MQVSRQAIYRVARRRTDPGPRPVDRALVEVARHNPTDGTRMWRRSRAERSAARSTASGAQRVMRAQRLLQRYRRSGRRRRPGFFRVERPDQLWHMDRSAVWVAEHG